MLFLYDDVHLSERGQGGPRKRSWKRVTGKENQQREINNQIKRGIGPVSARRAGSKDE